VTDPQNSRTSPTVILIGGQMVTDDGTRLDSRQPIEGDHRSEVMLRSLATSLLWWRSASSVVSPILDNAGSKTFALLICTKRTVVELGHDGNLQHTRLSAFIRGGTTTTELTRVLGGEQLPDDYEQADVLTERAARAAASTHPRGHQSRVHDLPRVGPLDREASGRVALPPLDHPTDPRHPLRPRPRQRLRMGCGPPWRSSLSGHSPGDESVRRGDGVAHLTGARRDTPMITV